MPIQQTRIALQALQVAQFASEETLCFSATVVFDGIAIATARNQGHGGPTFIQALEGKQTELAAAEAYAKSFPAQETEFKDPKHPTGKMWLEVDLEYLVDELAEEMNLEKKLRAMFKRHSKRVMFISKGELRFLKKTNAQTLKDAERVYAKIRKDFPEARVLNELPPEEAYQLYKQAMLADE